MERRKVHTEGQRKAWRRNIKIAMRVNDLRGLEWGNLREFLGG